MTVIVLILLITLLLYVILISGYVIKWVNCPAFLPDGDHDTPCFSVIVPFRNEQSRLGDILNDLALQDYPTAKTEIIWVDDHSNDDSASLVSEYCSRYGHFRLIQLPGGATGKKEAIKAGIQNARHEYIITTDADCRAGSQWLLVTASYCYRFSPAMVIGLVVPEAEVRGLFGYFQQLESLSLTGAGAASAIGGKPIFCSGANLCYRKDFYSRIIDPMIKSVPSGDDTFLLLQMKQHYPAAIRVLKSGLATITTKQESGIAGFFRQRSRWISKSAHYRDPEILYAAMVVLLTNLSVLLSAALMIAGALPWLFPVVFVVKIIADGLFLSSLTSFFEIKFRLAGFVLSSFVYPFYLVFGIAMACFFPVDWKGRKYHYQ